MMHAPGVHYYLDHLQSRSSTDSRTRGALREALRVPQTPPSPLAGEGWGGGWLQTPHMSLPPSLSLPRKGGGNAVALTFASLPPRPLLSTYRGLNVARRCMP